MPAQTLANFRRTFLSESQFLTLALAIVTSWIGIRTATLPTVINEADAWADAIQATIYVAAAWLSYCFARAPLDIVHFDKRVGQFFENRFVPHQPVLAASFLCQPTGKFEWFDLKFDVAEPNSFVHYKIEIDPEVPKARFTAFVTGHIVMASHTKPGVGIVSGGTRIGSQCEASLGIVIQEETVPLLVRVYMRDFSIGNPDEAIGKPNQSNRVWPHN